MIHTSVVSKLIAHTRRACKMSLYGDLPEPGAGGVVGIPKPPGPAPMLPPSLVSRRPGAPKPKPVTLSLPSSHTGKPLTTVPESGACGLLQHVTDLYDPAQPNDYMEWCEERMAKRKEEQRQRDLQRHLEEQERLVCHVCRAPSSCADRTPTAHSVSGSLRNDRPRQRKPHRRRPQLLDAVVA